MFAPVQVAAIAALNGAAECVSEINAMYKRGATCSLTG